MKQVCFALFFLITTPLVFAQDDLLSALSKEDKTTTPVFATFKGERLVSAQTTEQLKKKHFNFNILHRFGPFSSGIQDFYGLDQGDIRFVLEYGINNKIQVNIGRTNVNKTYDIGLKAKILEQKTGYKPFPFSLSYYGDIGINTSSSKIFDYETGLSGALLGRLNFTNQILISQKLNNEFSWLIAPTAVYYNLVDLAAQKNFALFLGLGLSTKISRSTRLNIEYYPRLTNRGSVSFSGAKTYDHLGLGFDIETGGHVFQFMFTNSSAMLEQQFLTQTTSSWTDWGIRLGFNISRTYSFEKRTATTSK